MTFKTSDLIDGNLPLVERIDRALRRVTNGEGQMRVPVEATDVDIVLHNCRDRIAELEAELASKDQRIAELERLFALNPIKVGDISVTLGVNEAGEWRMIFDGADDAKLAVVAGLFSAAMQAVMESAK